MLVDGAVESSISVGIAMIATAAAQRNRRDAGLFLTLHGSAAYLHGFLGDRPAGADRGLDPLAPDPGWWSLPAAGRNLA